jgi:hypothetical protein
MEAFQRDHPMYNADILPRPIGEMLGDRWMQTNRPGNAVAAYQAALQIAPNQLDSLLGSSKAAKLNGHRALAESYRTTIRKENGRFAKCA